MKWVCILLLIGNVAFIGWRMNQRLYGPAIVTPETTVEPLPEGAPSLTLLREATEPPQELEAKDVMGESERSESPPESAESAPAMSVADTPSPKEAASSEPEKPAASPPALSAAGPESGVEPKPAPVAEAPAPDAVSEVTAQKPEAEPATSTATTVKLACTTIGPYANRSEMVSAQERIAAIASRVSSRSQASRAARMFTVFLEPSENEAEAERRIEELKSKGITDYFLVRRGEMRNAIQVGTFRSQESVTKRLAEMERSGYKAVVVPKSDGATQYWLDVTYDSSRDTLESFKDIAGKGIKVTAADCPP